MRFLVSCGIERAEGESFRTAETVPGVSPTCSATALSVTTVDLEPVLLVGDMRSFQILELRNQGVSERLILQQIAKIRSCPDFSAGRSSCLRVPLAVRSRSTQREKQNVKVANDRKEESVMNTDAVRNCSLRHGNKRSAHDRHNHDPGTVPGERTKLRHAQRENAREHDRIEKSNQDDAVHRRVSRGQHRDRDQGGGADRTNAKEMAGAHLLQESGTDEAANHSASPV